MTGPIKILLVDDHQLMVEGVMELLEKNGNNQIIATANSAKRALDILSHTKVDLTITDINMSEMKGTELIQKLKSSFPDMKIIALSQHQETHIVKDVLKAGVDGYVLKNSTQDELQEAIEKCMAGENWQ